MPKQPENNWPDIDPEIAEAASVPALAFYVVERIEMAVEEGHINVVHTIDAILSTLVCVNGVRGTFAHRAYERNNQEPPLTFAAIVTKTWRGYCLERKTGMERGEQCCMALS